MPAVPPPPVRPETAPKTSRNPRQNRSEEHRKWLREHSSKLWTQQRTAKLDLGLLFSSGRDESLEKSSLYLYPGELQSEANPQRCGEVQRCNQQLADIHFLSERKHGALSARPYEDVDAEISGK
ncbi:hypothetical protein MHYP_G00062630 [Metynnis hypsauchen]